MLHFLFFLIFIRFCVLKLIFRETLFYPPFSGEDSIKCPYEPIRLNFLYFSNSHLHTHRLSDGFH